MTVLFFPVRHRRWAARPLRSHPPSGDARTEFHRML